MILYRTDEEEHRISFACFFLHFNIQLESFKFCYKSHDHTTRCYGHFYQYVVDLTNSKTYPPNHFVPMLR